MLKLWHHKTLSLNLCIHEWFLLWLHSSHNKIFTIVIKGYYEQLQFFLKLGCARSEVSSPFTTHSQRPLVRWHLQSSRQDGSHAGQDQAKLSGLLSANLFQCGSTVSEPHASGASGHQIWSIHVVTTCGRDSPVGPWLTDPVIGSECVFVCRPASPPSSLQLYVFVLCLRLYVLLSLCTSACSYGAPLPKDLAARIGDRWDM